MLQLFIMPIKYHGQVVNRARTADLSELIIAVLADFVLNNIRDLDTFLKCYPLQFDGKISLVLGKFSDGALLAEDVSTARPEINMWYEGGSNDKKQIDQLLAQGLGPQETADPSNLKDEEALIKKEIAERYIDAVKRLAIAIQEQYTPKPKVADSETQSKALAPQAALQSNVANSSSKAIALNSGAIKLGKEIGSGTFATVFQATYQDELCAIKRFTKRFPSNMWPSSQYISEEIQIMQKLQHQNITKLIAYNDGPSSTAFIIMELVTGGTLNAALRNKPIISWEAKLKIIYGASAGLEYLHGIDVVHCDIKTENILISADGQGKLADFGFSFIQPKEGPKRDLYRGTPIWQAPEVLLNRSGNSFKSDVYSMGMVLWAVTANAEPFASITHIDDFRLMLIKHRRPPIKPGISAEYKNLMTRCWDEDPKTRPTAQKLAEELRAQQPSV